MKLLGFFLCISLIVSLANAYLRDETTTHRILNEEERSKVPFRQCLLSCPKQDRTDFDSCKILCRTYRLNRIRKADEEEATRKPLHKCLSECPKDDWTENKNCQLVCLGRNRPSKNKDGK